MADASSTTADIGGAYELLRSRLDSQAAALAQILATLNQKRLDTFGSTRMEVIGRARIRTENNCVPRDIIEAGPDLLLFGYNVFVGMRQEVAVGDVFSLHRMSHGAEGYDFPAAPLAGTFLDDARFVADFKEVYRYYKDARLSLLRNVDRRKLAVFQTGKTLLDLKVFRWQQEAGGGLSYLDNRGERDHVFPLQHDFQWTATSREQHVAGRHPHVSILDQVFVETVGGTLTVKIENNTEDGQGIYNEPVADANQSLADAQIEYAKLGGLILLKIRPYREEHWRYLVFNTRARQVTRIDAIGQACVQLPEDHGLIFPGGYYLQSGELKLFEGEDYADMRFARAVRSPNGEDVLYVFLHLEQGKMALLSYNLIRKEVFSPPLVCHGYSLFEDGRMVVFRANHEANRVHPVEIWQTPYFSEEHAARAPAGTSFLARIGNADLVRGISDGFSIKRLLDEAAPALGTYEAVIAAANRMRDAYHWLEHTEAGNPWAVLKEIQQNAELILDEFEKVQALKQQARKALAEAKTRQQAIFVALKKQPEWREISEYLGQLEALRQQRGHLITLKELRYADLAALDALEQAVAGEFDTLGRLTVTFLLGENALQPYHGRLDELLESLPKAGKTTEADALAGQLQEISGNLDLLNEVLAGLPVSDPEARARMLDGIAEVYAKLNRARAELGLRRKQLLSGEAKTEFAAQFKLFNQSVAGAMAQADSPDKADELLSRLMVQLEELDSRFSEFDEFIGPLAAKREEVYSAFEARKQSLIEARNRRALSLSQAAERILQGIARRLAGLPDADAQNAFFATDAMVLKVRDLAATLRDLGDAVKAGDVEGKLKSLRDQAVRELRDKQEIFSEGGNVIKLGRHAFSVNTQALDLSLIPREVENEKRLALHLSGTDFFQDIADERLDAARAYWDQSLVSESAEVYRGEYLAAEMFFSAFSPSPLSREERGFPPSPSGRGEGLRQAMLTENGLLDALRRFAAERYDEGYERGVHDVDAARILEKLLELYDTADFLRYSPECRVLAQLFWCFQPAREQAVAWEKTAKNLRKLYETYASPLSLQNLPDFYSEISQAIAAFQNTLPGLRETDGIAQAAAEYLIEELQNEPLAFTVSGSARQLAEGFWKDLETRGKRRQFEDDLAALGLERRLGLSLAWLEAYAGRRALTPSPSPGERGEKVPLPPGEGFRVRAADLLESAALMLTAHALNHQENSASVGAEIKDLLGQHPRLQDRMLRMRLDEFLVRLNRHRAVHAPAFRAFRELRQSIVARERERLRLDELKPRPLTTFVRNKLIDQVYLPLIGDNLAKQMGSLGDSRRTDQMGLLLLISPPGYGKTTLIEYLAQRLGLVFVKINCPTLGHSVTSIDPGEAPNATARQELEKLNLALEMGNNVMLYLDDIQHSSPELLQKFISLADAQRRIEGVWQGRTRTHDFRGKRFCIVMAGNPYTESGEVFKIPDMLANRADIYNLGDILGGKEDIFALSYLENALTSNPALAPLANRDKEDVYRLIRLAQGEEVPASEFAYAYPASELRDILAVLKKLFRVRDVLLRVNQQYIASASQAGHYRAEPPFKLQGSYRNMNKLAEKVVAVMNDQELENLISDHYQGEAQTLTGGAEDNLLKFAELRGIMTNAQKKRWEEIKKTFNRLQNSGDPEADPVSRVINQLSGLGEHLAGLREVLHHGSRQGNAVLLQHLGQINAHLAQLPKLLEKPGLDSELKNSLLETARSLSALPDLARAAGGQKPEVRVINQLPGGLDSAIKQMVDTLDHSLIPMAKQIGRLSRMDFILWERLKEVSNTLKTVYPEAFNQARLQHGEEPLPVLNEVAE